MNRRKFNLLGLGLLSSSLAVALAACRPSTDTAETTEDGFVAVGTVAELDAQGVLANGNLQGANLAVIRDPANPEGVVALSARCTHAGCTVEWNGDRSEFICPCHGGRFGPDGSVNSGPPPRPLETFAARIDGDQVLVKV